MQVVAFAGAPQTLPINTALTFIGTPVTITVATSQRLVASGSFSAYSSPGAGIPEMRYSLCYQLSGGPLTLFEDPNFFTVNPPTSRYTSFSASLTAVPGAAGEYQVGICARNPSSTIGLTINRTAGWVMVTNQ